jgi:DNA-binding transcriptional regulator YdaS (Cro superfamily)
MNTNTPIKTAIEAMGSKAALASALLVTAPLVHQWASGLRPVAGHHCPAIERLTGVRCEELRPDLDWLRDESGSATGYQVRARAA